MPPRPTVELLDHGAIVVRGLLSEAEQALVLAKAFELRPPGELRAKADGLYSTLWAWGWPGRRVVGERFEARERDEPALMEPVVELGRRGVRLALEAAAERLAEPHEDPRLRPPPRAFDPRALRCILYPDNGRLHAHQDMMMGWAGSISVGRACEFFFGPGWEPDAPGTRFVTLRSGDFMLFNGQALTHGVSRLLDVDEEPAPELWRRVLRNGIVPRGWGRLNLQLRDPSAMERGGA